MVLIVFVHVLVTWGAGGSTADLTIQVQIFVFIFQICQTAQAVYGLETCMHL
jgi:methylenetetrahydrofolate reductase (NADPH)